VSKFTVDNLEVIQQNSDFCAQLLLLSKMLKICTETVVSDCLFTSVEADALK